MEIKQEVKTSMINYMCDSCKKAHLKFTNKVRQGVKLKYYIHICPKCNRMQEIEGKAYPMMEYEPIQKNGEVN